MNPYISVCPLSVFPPSLPLVCLTSSVWLTDRLRLSASARLLCFCLSGLLSVSGWLACYLSVCSPFICLLLSFHVSQTLGEQKRSDVICPSLFFTSVCLCTVCVLISFSISFSLSLSELGLSFSLIYPGHYLSPFSVFSLCFSLSQSLSPSLYRSLSLAPLYGLWFSCCRWAHLLKLVITLTCDSVWEYADTLP